MYVDTCFGCLNLIRIFETLFYVCSVWCSTCRTADSAVQCWGLECPNFASNNDCSRGLLAGCCLDSTTSYDYLTMPHTTSPHNRKLGKLFSAQLWKMGFFLVEPRGHVLPVTSPQSLARVRAVSRVTCHVLTPMFNWWGQLTLGCSCQIGRRHTDWQNAVSNNFVT